MRNYIPPDLARVHDPILRAILRPMDDWLRSAAAQISTNASSNTSSSAGNVSSIDVNSLGRTTGDIDFNDSTTIGLFQAGQIITWGVLSLPAAVFGAVSGLNATTVTTNGVALTAARSDHLHAVASGAQTGFYGTAPTVGAGSDFLRASGVLVYPEALGTAADRADTLTLTDDGTEGCLLTASNTFSVNAAAIKAPNATNALRIGKYGNISMAGTVLSDTTLLHFIKTDYNETLTTPTGIAATITNSNTGVGGVIGRGMTVQVNAPMSGAAAASTNIIEGIRLTMSGGNIGNSRFTGSIYGFKVSSNSVTNLVAATAVPLVVDFQSATTTTIRSALTQRVCFDALGAISLSGGTLATIIGYRCTTLAQGTNRYGMYIEDISGGTVATGIEIETHTGGTTRRAIRGGNTFESTANDFLCNTAAKGFICKDGAGTPVYWRYTVAADGTPAIVNAGTTAPTT